MDWRIPYAALREAFPQVESDCLKAAVSKYGNNVHQAAEYILNEVAPPDLSLSALREASSSRNANARTRSRPSRSGATSYSSSSDSDGSLTSGGRNRGAGGGRRTGRVAANAAGSGGANVSGSRGSDKSSGRQSSTGNQLPGHEKGSDNRSKDATAKRGSSGAQFGPVVIDASQPKTVSEVDVQSQAASASDGDPPTSAQGMATGCTAAASTSNAAPLAVAPSKETEIEELPDSSEETAERGKTEGDGKFSESGGNTGSNRYKSLLSDETDGLVASCIRFAQTFAEAKGEGCGQNEEYKLSSDQTENGDCSSDSDKLVRPLRPIPSHGSVDGGLLHENDDGGSESLEANSRLGGIHTIELSTEREGDDGSANVSGKAQGTALDVDVKGDSVESSAAEVKNGGIKSGAEGGEDATGTNLSSLEGETELQKTSQGKEQGIESVPEEAMESCEGDDTGREQKSIRGDDEPVLVGQTEGQGDPSEASGGVDGERSKTTEDGSSCPPLQGPQEEENGEGSSSAGKSSGAGAKKEGGGKDALRSRLGEGDSECEDGKAEGASALSEKQLVPVHSGAQGAIVAAIGVQDLGASRPEADWAEVNEETIASLEELVSEALSWKDLLRQKIAEVRALHAEAEATEAAAVEARTEAQKGGLTEWLQVVQLREKVDRSKEAYEQREGDVHGEKAVLGTEARELRSRLIHVASEKAAAMERLKEVEDALQARISVARKALKEAQDELNSAKVAAMKALAIEEANMARVAREAERLEREAETCTKLREFLISQGKNVDALQGEVAVLLEDVDTLKSRLESGGGGSSCIPVADATSTPQGTTLQSYPLMCSLSASGSRTSYMPSSSSFLMNVREGCMASSLGVCERAGDPSLVLSRLGQGNLSSSGFSTGFGSQLCQSFPTDSRLQWSPQRRDVVLGSTPFPSASLNGSCYSGGADTCKRQQNPVGEADSAVDAPAMQFGLHESTGVSRLHDSSGTRATQSTLLDMQVGGSSPSWTPGRQGHVGETGLPNVPDMYGAEEEEHKYVEAFFEGEAAEQIEYEMRLAMSRNKAARDAAETHDHSAEDRSVIVKPTRCRVAEWRGEGVAASGAGTKSGLDDDGWQLLEMGGAVASKAKADGLMSENGDAQLPNGTTLQKTSAVSMDCQPAADAAVLL